MIKKRKNKNEDLFDFSDNLDIKENKKKSKERTKRIKNKKKQEKEQFDIDNEVVIDMTNNNKDRLDKKKKISGKQAKILRKKKKIKRVLKWCTLILLITGSIIFALVSPIFNINEIQVYDNSRVSTNTIISLSQLNLGQNIFRFKSSYIKKELKSNAYIENAKVKRVFPNKVDIFVEERNRNFNVEFLNEYAYINNQGYILEISENKDDLTTIQGIFTAPENIKPGNRLDRTDLEKLERVIQIINICKEHEIDKKITNINIENKDNFILYLEQEKKYIHLGDQSNLSNKMLYVTTILKDTEGIEGTIYVNGDLNNNFKPRFREKV